MLKLQGKHLVTFTEVPRPGFDGAIVNGRYADETPLVHAMARMHNNIDVNFIRTDGRFFLEEIEPFFNAAEMPFEMPPTVSGGKRFTVQRDNGM